MADSESAHVVDTPLNAANDTVPAMSESSSIVFVDSPNRYLARVDVEGRIFLLFNYRY